MSGRLVRSDLAGSAGDIPEGANLIEAIYSVYKPAEGRKAR